MGKEIIKKTFKEVKKVLLKTGECPGEGDLARFVEGTMDEREAESIAEHLVLCSKCCDCVVFLNKVINFQEEEEMPEVPAWQVRKVSALVEDKKRRIRKKGTTTILEDIAQSIRDFFSFDWMAQPIPVAVRSGALAILVVIVVSTTFFYYRTPSLGLHMEVMGKSGMVSMRGKPEIIKEGDTLYSNDYCRVNFELDQDAYAYVLYHDSTDKLHQLYPDPAQATPRKVKGKEKYSIPEGGNWFKLDDNTGTETVFVLASEKPISGLKESFDSIQGSSREEILEAFKDKAPVVKVISFKHQ